MDVSPPDRPARKDVVRNRARLIASARAVFAEHGLDATLDDVARHAGVGVGTAYRHFANKQELAAEVLADATQQIVVDAENALAIDDPWEGLSTFFLVTAERQARDRGLYQMLTGQGRVDDADRIWPQIIQTFMQLFDRARDAGVIRADAEPTDAATIFAMLGVAFDVSNAAAAPDLWRRYLALMLDGLRAVDRPALPAGPLPLDRLQDAFAAGKRHGGRGSS